MRKTHLEKVTKILILAGQGREQVMPIVILAGDALEDKALLKEPTQTSETIMNGMKQNNFYHCKVFFHFLVDGIE